ncbi:MAG TPA: polysaccharide deacetylase family protein [Bacteroidales bacterium]|nr:polysaccharide deacetylase family protein [Bacteroidales bacterium]
MPAIRAPFIYRWLSNRDLVCEMPPGDRVLYLTFDDGPIPEVTPEVLRILKERNAKATFFCVGDNVQKHPDVFDRIVRDGHAAGNHTFNHLDGWRTLPGEYADNVMHCNTYFRTTLFRPPYGRFTPREFFLLRKQFRFILWSVLSGDYHHGTSPEQCLQNVLNYACDGSIIVFHDSLKAKEKVLYALPAVLDHFTGKGFAFKSLPQGSGK